jgi:predicted metal-dependent phosphoesterase TrpH
MPGQVPETELVPGRAVGRGRDWYRGDLHLHSARSHGGQLTPAQLVAGARASGLDFIAVTEHNTTDTHDAFVDLAGQDLLVIGGQEVVTPTGHWLALGIDRGQVVEWRYSMRDGEIGQHLSRVRQAGGLCVAAHPHAPYPGGLLAYPLADFDAVEVWNGLWSSDRPWNADNRAATAEWGRTLAAGALAGKWQPAIGSSDTHLEGQIAVPHTVVLADRLTSSAVLAGIRAGASWIAGSAVVSLSLHVQAGDRSAGIGGRLDTGGEPVVVRVVVGGVPSGTISFHTDRGAVNREPLPADGQSAVEWRTSAAESLFVRVEVHHPGQQMAALTNPVFLA